MRVPTSRSSVGTLVLLIVSSFAISTVLLARPPIHSNAEISPSREIRAPKIRKNGPTPEVGSNASAERRSFLQRAIDKYWGYPYGYGANGPNAYDCSAFVSKIVNDTCRGFGGARLTTSHMSSHLTRRPSCHQSKPGDIMLWPGEHVTFVLNSQTLTNFGASESGRDGGVRQANYWGSPTCYRNPCFND